VGADASLLLVALIWGATFVIVQQAISFLEPLTFNGIRFFLAFLLLLVWLLLFERQQLKQLNLKVILSGSFIGLWLFTGYAFQTVGLLYTTSSKAGFITGLSVILVPVLSLIFLKHRPSMNAILGVLVATIGLYLLTMTGITSFNIGDGLVFFCAIGFALHIIFTGKFSASFPSLLLTIVQVLTVSVLSFLFAFFYENWQLAFQTEVLQQREVMVALIITSVFATALAFFAQTNFQKYTTPTRVALIFAMEPVFAAITAFIWADERLSTSALFGCLLIFVGMIFAELPKKTLLSIKPKTLN
jgi:drug/metabolite transporter (DMT)-like permease